MSKVKKVFNNTREFASASVNKISAVASGTASALQYTVLFLAFVLYLADIFMGNAFDRSPGMMLWWLFAYMLVGILMFAAYQSQVERSHLLRECIRLSLLSWGIPVAIVYLQGGVLDGLPWVFAGALGNYLGVWAMILLVYWFGWPREVMTVAGSGEGFFSKLATFVNGVVIFVILAALLIAVFGALDQGGQLEQAGISNYSYEQVSVGDIWSDAVGFFSRLAQATTAGVTGRVNDTTGLFGTQLAQATEAEYKGTVERHQGQPLGVFVRNQQPIKQSFNFIQQEDGENIVGDDETVVWFGDLHARTFADELPVSLSCGFIPSVDRENIANGTVSPSDIRVYYTGEFTELFPFECRIPMQDIHDVTERGSRLGGSFMTFADFEFQTWGYATLTFMDRNVITAFRREGRDPARELGVDSFVQARYTPGPVSLGMMDRQQLPLGIDTQDPSSTFIPAFGVTLRNIWDGRGEVRRINKLVFQVPEPLMLDVNACSGNTDDQGRTITPTVRSPGSSVVLFTTTDSASEVPQGYIWYEFEGIDFSSDERLRTVRCPMMVADDRYGELIGPDLSVNEFTLVALADYEYRSQTPAPVSLRVERRVS